MRAIDSSGDWLFGKSLNDYISANMAVKQNIKTRLLSFLGNCFFDITAGVDWFNLLGSKDQTALSLAISTIILNTQDVTGIIELSISLNTNREFSISYQVQTSYSIISGSFQYSALNSPTA